MLMAIHGLLFFPVQLLPQKGMRFVKNVGLGFKTPKLAKEGTYVDKKCPFTGDVSIRGRILKVSHEPLIILISRHWIASKNENRGWNFLAWFCSASYCCLDLSCAVFEQGLVISAGKMTNTIVIRRDYLHYVSKYRRWGLGGFLRVSWVGRWRWSTLLIGMGLMVVAGRYEKLLLRPIHFVATSTRGMSFLLCTCFGVTFHATGVSSKFWKAAQEHDRALLALLAKREGRGHCDHRTVQTPV